MPGLHPSLFSLLSGWLFFLFFVFPEETSVCRYRLTVCVCGRNGVRLPTSPSCFCSFFLRFFIHLFMRHTERDRERVRDPGRGRSRLHAGSLMWDSIPGAQDQALG